MRLLDDEMQKELSLPSKNHICISHFLCLQPKTATHLLLHFLILSAVFYSFLHSFFGEFSRGGGGGVGGEGKSIIIAERSVFFFLPDKADDASASKLCGNSLIGSPYIHSRGLYPLIKYFQNALFCHYGFPEWLFVYKALSIVGIEALAVFSVEVLIEGLLLKSNIVQVSSSVPKLCFLHKSTLAECISPSDDAFMFCWTHWSHPLTFHLVAQWRQAAFCRSEAERMIIFNAPLIDYPAKGLIRELWETLCLKIKSSTS